MKKGGLRPPLCFLGQTERFGAGRAAGGLRFIAAAMTTPPDGNDAIPVLGLPYILVVLTAATAENSSRFR